MKNGITLFNLRDRMRTLEDGKATLSVLKKSRVDVVQISGIGSYGIPGISKTIGKLGITVPVTHVSFDRMLDDAEALAEEHKSVGCSFAGVGCMPGEYEKTPEGQDKFFADLRRASENLAKYGIKICYHNHDFDCKPFGEGRSNIDRMVEDFAPDELYFIPDVAWLKIGGLNPVKVLERMKGRIAAVHFKDYRFVDGERRFCELTMGEVELRECYKKAEELGVEYAIFEQDNDWIDGNAMNATLGGCAVLDAFAEGI